MNNSVHVYAQRESCEISVDQRAFITLHAPKQWHILLTVKNVVLEMHFLRDIWKITLTNTTFPIHILQLLFAITLLLSCCKQVFRHFRMRTFKGLQNLLLTFLFAICDLEFHCIVRSGARCWIFHLQYFITLDSIFYILRFIYCFMPFVIFI